MHAVFIVPILVVAALGRATLAWWRLCGSLHTYNVGKGAIWAKSSAGARERNSTSKIRLRRDGGTHHYNFPLSAREHNSKHVASPARKRKPPAPACLFRPPRGGQGLRASASTRNR